MSKRLITATLHNERTEMSELASLSMLGVAGFLIGYAIKKLIKLLLFLAGLFLLALVGLEYLGAIKIYYDKLGETLINILSSIQKWLPEIIPTISGMFYSISFGGGFLLGLLKG